LLTHDNGTERISRIFFTQQAGELAGSIEATVETSSVVYAATRIAKFYSNPPALTVVDDNYQKLRKVGWGGAADKAAIQLVQVQPRQLPMSDT